MTTLSRRTALLTSVAVTGTPAILPAARKAMMLAMHQTTSAGAGYRKSLEGWSRAGIQYVELSNVLLDDFLKTENVETCRRVLSDLGLTAVQGATGVTGLFEPNPDRSGSLDQFKKRCETYAALGLKNVYATTLTTQ